MEEVPGGERGPCAESLSARALTEGLARVFAGVAGVTAGGLAGVATVAAGGGGTTIPA